MNIRKKLNAPVVQAIVGSVLQGVIWLYVAISVFGAYSRFYDAVAQFGESTQLRGELYGNIYGIVLFGGALSVIGLAISMEVAIRSRYRARWFFWASLSLALPACILFPVGTLIGLIFICYLLIKRKEFTVPNKIPE